MYLHIKLKLNKKFHSLQMFLFSQQALVYMFTKTVTQCLHKVLCLYSNMCIYIFCLFGCFFCVF